MSRPTPETHKPTDAEYLGSPHVLLHRVNALPPCGCAVEGHGLIPSPVVIIFCPLHARALAMRDLLQELHDAVYLWPLGADGYHETWMKARALLKEIE